MSKDLSVHETFVGFYEIAATDASTRSISQMMCLKRFELSIANCRGQCFDGASNVAGHVSGLQKRITDTEPTALYVHCFNHSLSLAFPDCISVVPQCWDAMNQIKDLINFVRESLKRLAWFKEFQDSDLNPMLRPLCPIR